MFPAEVVAGGVPAPFGSAKTERGILVCMRVSAIQLGYSDSESLEDRVVRAAHAVESQREADLIVLPELWAPTGFDYTKWGKAAQAVDGPVIERIAHAARSVGAYVHAGSIIEASPHALDRLKEANYDVKALPVLADDERGLWNTSVLINPDGQIQATYRKIHRFGFGSGEPKLLQPGTEIVIPTLNIDGRETRFALATCYDLRFPELFRQMVAQGAEGLIIPAAWPAPRVREWSALLRARSIENLFPIVAVNTAGYHGGTQMGGHSVILDAAGLPLAEAGEAQTIITATIDLDATETRRERFPALDDRRLNYTLN